MVLRKPHMNLFKHSHLAKILFCSLAFISALSSSYIASAQNTADKILIVVGRNRIILQSELDMQFTQMKQQDPNMHDSMKCLLLQQMVLKKLLLEQAERDSVSVTDEDVEGQLDNRLRYFIQLYGSKEKLEQMSGKTVYQIKDDFRESIREEIVAEKMQGQILENTKISPSEIQAFYKKIPVDSLPFYPANVEVGQIVLNPQINPEVEEYAHSKMEDIRKQVVEGGKNFEVLAGIYSDDPGSRDNGGRYDGVTKTGPWAPEFINAAFKLQNNEISPIFKTRYGYHIIQMISRRGDEADLRHILIRPEITKGDFEKSLHTLDSIYTLILTKKFTFQEAVGKFSTDENAKRTGGMITDQNSGSSSLDISKLDAAMVLMLDSLQPGECSKPHIYINEGREQACRIIYLKSRTAPHKANLKDDYNKIMDVALAQKKQIKMQTWIKNKLSTFYLKINPEYANCSSLKELQLSINGN